MESVAALTSRGFVGERSAGWGVRVSVGEACSDMLVDIYCRALHGRHPPCFPVLKLSLSPLLLSCPPINAVAADCWFLLMV